MGCVQAAGQGRFRLESELGNVILPRLSGSLQTTTCSNAAQWFTYWMNREQTFKHTMVGYLSYLERGALLILIRF